MAKGAGRKLVLAKGGTALAGVTAVSWKMDATPIDVTDFDSNGVVELLAGAAASRQLSIDVSGIATGTSPLRTLALNPASDLMLTDITLTDPGAAAIADVISGNFFLTNFANTGEDANATTFTATLVSSGNWAVA